MEEQAGMHRGQMLAHRAWRFASHRPGESRRSAAPHAHLRSGHWSLEQRQAGLARSGRSANGGFG